MNEFLLSNYLKKFYPSDRTGKTDEEDAGAARTFITFACYNSLTGAPNSPFMNLFPNIDETASVNFSDIYQRVVNNQGRKIKIHFGIKNGYLRRIYEINGMFEILEPNGAQFAFHPCSPNDANNYIATYEAIRVAHNETKYTHLTVTPTIATEYENMRIAEIDETQMTFVPAIFGTNCGFNPAYVAQGHLTSVSVYLRTGVVQYYRDANHTYPPFP